jgi:hypothetical protein
MKSWTGHLDFPPLGIQGQPQELAGWQFPQATLL